MKISVFLSAVLALQFSQPAASWADANSPSSLLTYIQSRKDLTKRERSVWKKQVRRQFGRLARTKAGQNRSALHGAKQVLSAAIFLKLKPRRGVKLASEARQAIKSGLSPHIVIYYQLLSMQERRPPGRMVDFAFRFPDYYSDEFAPGVVRSWELALERGSVPDARLDETMVTLRSTQVKMRPLLLDKLRTLSKLVRQEAVYDGLQKKLIQSDIRLLEKELTESFTNVAQRPEVLKSTRRPFDRLRIQIELMNLSLSDEERFLEPNGVPPPKRPVPIPRSPEQVSPDSKSGEILSEPTSLPPSPPPPPQPRPGDLQQYGPSMTKSELRDLLNRYRIRLSETINPWIGTPHRWGGNLRQTGTDSAGFIQAIYKAGFNLELPRKVSDQYKLGRSVAQGRWRPGDLIFFDIRDRGVVDHVAIYLGNGAIIRVSHTRGVIRDKIKRRIYRHTYRGARRILASSRQ